MEKLQQEIFAKTEKLIAQFSILRVLFLATLSAGLILILLLALSFGIDIYTVLFVVGISLAYSFLRDFFMTRYTKKVMHTYHDYLKELKPRVQLYIPVFAKTGQGFILKKAALYIDNGSLFMEAYNQHKRGNKPDQSISIKAGGDFIIEAYYLKKDERFVTYRGSLMETPYEFSIVNVKELVDLVEAKKGGKI